MPLAPTCDLFVIAGEASGDAYAAAVVQQLRAQHVDAVCAGMGGPALQAAGVEIEQSIEGLSVMGFLPVLRRLPTFIKLGWHLKQVIRARRPKVVLTVDYPGFNLRLARSLSDLRANGTRFLHLVAPQVWAWKRRRAKVIARSVDRVLCFFPFEPPLFQRHGGTADFVGHPLPDLIPEHLSTLAVEQELGLAREDRLLLLAPGSREREIRSLLPIFDRVAESMIARLGGGVKVAIAKASELDRSVYREYSDFPLVEGRFRELCARTHVGLVASGTATLEAAIIGMPHVIAYRTDPLSAALARHLLLVDHIGLPNIIHGKRVCPEVLQDQLDEERLSAHAMTLWHGPRRDECVAALRRTRELLGGGGAMARIAKIVAEELSLGQRRKDTFEVIKQELDDDREKTAPVTEIGRQQRLAE